MRTIEAENKKYFYKFGTVYSSNTDWRQKSLKALARCSVCVEVYGMGYKTDKLVLETRYGRDYLCCENHKRRSR